MNRDDPMTQVKSVQPVQRPDAFPTTRLTWLGQRVHDGPKGLSDANVHVMTIYQQPLKVYFLGCTLRWVGDPDDVIQGFFADRLSKPDFLSRWLASGRPLRYWLIVGFKHYLLESARAVAKNRRHHDFDPNTHDVGADDPGCFDRELAVNFVREATLRAEKACAANGLGDHWRIFVEHHVNGVAYEQIAPRFKIDRARAAVMARTAATRFKNELRALIAWEGASDEQIDQEIRSLLEATGT